MRDRQFGNHLNDRYGRVIAYIREADSVEIFGPGEANGELKKRIETKGIKPQVFAIETADKITDQQITAKVGENSWFEVCAPI